MLLFLLRTCVTCVTGATPMYLVLAEQAITYIIYIESTEPALTYNLSSTNRSGSSHL